MAEALAGIGTKRPQIDIPLNLIQLDSNNPRLDEEFQGATEIQILKELYEEHDLEEIGLSMVENGYFDEEPVVVVLENIPPNFEWSEDVRKLEKELEELIKTAAIKFIVIEGNRRIATAKILTEGTLRKALEIKSTDFPEIKNLNVTEDLKIIPSIVYKNRQDVSPYLGIRHIEGIRKWEAYAKARYIAKKIEEEQIKGKSVDEAIKELQKRIGDRSDLIRRQYMCYKVLEQANAELELNFKGIKDRFSLVAELINKSSIREFVGLVSYKDADFKSKLIPKEKLGNLDLLFTWVFGKGKDNAPIFTDSRKINSHLAPILADKEATEFLLKYNLLEEAYERSGGDKQFLIKKLNFAKRAISAALGVAFKYKSDKEILDNIDEIKKAMRALEEMTKEND